MRFFGLNLWLLYVVVGLVLIEVGTLIIYYCLKRLKKRRKQVITKPVSVATPHPVGQQAVLSEIARLSSGGDLDQAFVRSLFGADKALFEVALIDALTGLPRERQHSLRSTLVKHGYDEHCARRAMRGEISDRVRASTLHGLLHPQSHTTGIDSEGSMQEHHSCKVRSARSGAGLNGPEA